VFGSCVSIPDVSRLDTYCLVVMDRQSTLQVSDRLMSFAEVGQQLGVCSRTVRRLVERGDFPPPLRLGARTLRFRASEVAFYIELQSDLRKD